MSLFATQEAMRDALHGDESGSLTSLVAGRVAGIEVYRSMYWSRQTEALAEDFPELRKRLGEERFERLAVSHVRRHPSRHPSLALLGEHLADTLDHLGLDAEAAVARLEWARVQAFWSPDARVADASVLGALGSRLGEATLVFHPSLQLVEIPGFVRGGDPSSSTREHVVVWRRGLVVDEVAIPEREARALVLALAGRAVAEVCDVFAEADAPEEDSIAAFVRWVGSGWVVLAKVTGCTDTSATGSG